MPTRLVATRYEEVTNYPSTLYATIYASEIKFLKGSVISSTT